MPVATCAYEVFCFEKVLMELVSSKTGISGSTDPNAYPWLEWTLLLIYENDSMTNTIYPSLIDDEDILEKLWAMALMASHI